VTSPDDDPCAAGPGRARPDRQGGRVTAAGLLTALLARPWGQAAEMLAALGVEPGQLATAATAIAVRPAVTPRPMPRDPSGLLSAAWRRPATETGAGS
jgi:hypothetical protein